MKHDDVRRTLLQDPLLPKEVRMNDGSKYTLHGVEQWLLTGDELRTASTGPNLTHNLALANIASISTIATHPQA